MDSVNKVLDKLSKSKFRSSFKLKQEDIEYIDKKGLDKIEEHALEFINNRLAPKYIANDGKQTPMKGHPVFKAQHATATCCRNCLFKWHYITQNKDLTDEEIKYIVRLIMTWIAREYYDFKC